MGSIEAAFIGLARYIRDHFPDLSWMPLWYGGIPFPDSYPPLLHTAVAAVSGVGHIPAALAYHFVTATLYSLAPVLLYWSLGRLSIARWAAIVASLGYSIFSPTIWWVPSFRNAIGGWWAPCRLDAMVSWGEGPHITSLMFLPLAMAALWAVCSEEQRDVRRRRLSLWFAAALVLAAAVLSNWIGALALGLIGVSLALSSSPKVWPWLAAAACWAYAIAGPFVTPSTVATIQANAPLVAAGGFQSNRLLEAAFAAAILLVAWALAKARVDRGIRFATLFFLLTAGITLLAQWFNLRMIPQPERYHLEMDLAFWVLVAMIATRIKVTRGWIVIAVAALVCLPVARWQHRRVRDLERPINIASTVEFEISRWFDEHRPGQRVFAPGTIGFWMQAFSDTPMLNGGFDNGESNRIMPSVLYQVYAGARQETMVEWLKAFGVDAVVGEGPKSREVYHPYAHPEKFAGLQELWRDGDDVIYAVPRRRTSLAHAMFAGDLPQTQPPAYDAKSLDHYLAALDEPSLPDAQFTWRGTSAATITGVFTPQHILSVQVTYDKGWRATVNGQARPVLQDKLGQMTIAPGCNGPCTVELKYDGGVEQQAARWISALGLLAGVAIVIKERFSK
ncbi:MAG TPA: hypothetical protein VHW24_27740 [Bryobacteraceae bacterium]|nr:hypothetical protein [Bryobacteraceae bacterium]